MQQKLTDFAKTLGLSLTPSQYEQLRAYADLVWQKKDQLNLTCVADKNEILTRHIADGFAVASIWNRHFAGQETGTVADMGSGAGYIGITLAIMCPHLRVSLIESLEKRCAFLNWVVLKLKLSNVDVRHMRLGQETAGFFDLVTERAMGPLSELLPLLASCVSEKGLVTAYQSQVGRLEEKYLQSHGLQMLLPLSYKLPEETKERYLMVFKHGYC